MGAKGALKKDPVEAEWERPRRTTHCLSKALLEKSILLIMQRLAQGGFPNDEYCEVTHYPLVAAYWIV